MDLAGSLLSLRVLIAALCALGSASAAAENYSCASLEYPPLIQRGADGKVEGASVEMLDAVFRRMGHTLTVEIYPWERSIRLVKEGRADCIFTIFRSPEREAFLDFSAESLALQKIYLYARRDRTLSFNGDMQSVDGARIGVVSAVSYGPKFEQARGGLDLDAAPSIEVNFRKLAFGRVDLVPSSAAVALGTLKKPALDAWAGQIVQLPAPLDDVPSYIGFSRARALAGLRDAFDAEFRRFKASREYCRILAKYDLPDRLYCPSSQAKR